MRGKLKAVSVLSRVCADLDCYQTQTLPSHSWKSIPLLWRLQTMKGSSSTPIGILTWEVQLHLPRASLACAIFRHWLTAFSSIPSVLRHGLCCVWAEMGGSESRMVYRHINPGVELNHSVVSLATSYSHKSQNCLIACQSPFITPKSPTSQSYINIQHALQNSECMEVLKEETLEIETKFYFGKIHLKGRYLQPLCWVGLCSRIRSRQRRGLTPLFSHRHLEDSKTGNQFWARVPPRVLPQLSSYTKCILLGCVF